MYRTILDKDDGMIEEYSFSQTTLEQVFLRFTHKQEEATSEIVQTTDDRSSY